MRSPRTSCLRLSNPRLSLPPHQIRALARAISSERIRYLLADEVGLGKTIEEAFASVSNMAEQHGKRIYDELVAEHEERLSREREKGDYAFAARRKAIKSVGLPEVRNHRLSRLEQEELNWCQSIDSQTQVMPEMTALLLLRVEGNSA